MFVFCLLMGIAMIAIGFAIIVNDHLQAMKQHWQRRRPMARRMSDKKLESIKRRQATRESGTEFVPYFECFEETSKSQIAIIEAQMPDLSDQLSQSLEMVGSIDSVLSIMHLESLSEIQNEEKMNRDNVRYLEMQMSKAQSKPVEVEKTRMLGDAACELGLIYLDELIAHRVVPRGRVSATNETNLKIARNAIEMRRQSATFSHGAIAQNIGEKAVCIFEPLEAPIQALDKALDDYEALIQNKVVFFILANTDDVPVENLKHINAIRRRFNIAKTNIFIRQADNTFVNYVEDVNNFVPSRIDVLRMPEQFFTQLLDYAHEAYDLGDTDTVLRVLGPLLNDLFARVQHDPRFSKLLAAQAFNLMGMTNRALEYDEEAIRCFEASLSMLRVIEAYDAIKSVQANLGISYALIRPTTPQSLDQAVRHLNEVTQLNPYDDESWIYLANTYLEQYRMTQKQGLIRHALRAYEHAEALAPSEEISLCVEKLRAKLGLDRAQQSANAAAAVAQAQNRNQLVRHAG